MAVRTFLHYALEVPDQTVGQRFYEDFGLMDGTGSSDAVRLRPEGHGRDAVLLYGGPRKHLHHLCRNALQFNELIRSQRTRSETTDR